MILHSDYHANNLNYFSLKKQEKKKGKKRLVNTIHDTLLGMFVPQR